MDLKEVDELSVRSERQHWWIKTRFLYIDKLFSFCRKEKIKVAEYGCGTGQNLWYLKERSSQSKKVDLAIGIDPNLDNQFEAEWIDEKFKLSNDLNTFASNEADVVLAMDVLEHIDDQEEALNHWVSTLNEDGQILITVPAFKSLWSYHDEFLDHKRRYTKKDLEIVARKCGLRPVYLSYAFGFLFPAVYIIRKLSKGSKDNQDLKLPNFILNSLLFIFGKVEKMLGGNPFFGTSVIGIFEKNE